MLGTDSHSINALLRTVRLGLVHWFCSFSVCFPFQMYCFNYQPVWLMMLPWLDHFVFLIRVGWWGKNVKDSQNISKLFFMDLRNFIHSVTKLSFLHIQICFLVKINVFFNWLYLFFIFVKDCTEPISRFSLCLFYSDRKQPGIQEHNAPEGAYKEGQETQKTRREGVVNTFCMTTRAKLIMDEAREG